MSESHELAVRHREDEFSFLRQRARAHGIPWPGRPDVERLETTVGSGRRISAIRWGKSNPRVVLLHGGAQNAHTWDAVILGLGLPAVCIDLPGHGWSEWREDHDYRPVSIAPDVADVIAALAPDADLLCGMSLGGMTAVAIAASRPELVRRLAVVDVAPGSGTRGGRRVFDFISGPEVFDSFDEILERAVRFSPGRSRDSLRIGILHNAVEQPDGTWRWRYDPSIGKPSQVEEVRQAMTKMWDMVEAIAVPTLLVKGADSEAVTPEAIREWRRRQPHVQIEIVDAAGHAVQSDQPVVLADLLRRLIDEAL